MQQFVALFLKERRQSPDSHFFRANRLLAVAVTRTVNKNRQAVRAEEAPVVFSEASEPASGGLSGAGL